MEPPAKNLFPAWSVVLLLAGAVLAVFAPFLDPHGQKILSEGGQDLDTQILWWRQFAFRELAQGHLALWNPFLFGGSPFFGYLQPGLVYPPNWLYLIWPLPFTVNFQIALHIFLAGWFAFLWINQREDDTMAGLLAGFMFMFGGALFLKIVPGHLLNISAMPWTALSLFAIEGYRKEKNWGYVLLGILSVGFQLLSGQMQIFYYSSLFLAAYVLCALPSKDKIRFLAGAAAIGLGGLLLGAVQLLAGWDAARESLRGAKMTLDMASSTSMAVEKFWCLFMPDLFGYWNDYWGARFYWEGDVYVGLAGLLLALVGARGSRPQKRFFVGAFLALALTAVGRRSFLYLLCFHALPFFGHFRGVAKLDFLMALCLAALAGMGWGEIREDGSKLKGLAKAAAWGAGVFVLAAALLKILAPLGGKTHLAKYMPYAGGIALSLLLAAWSLGLLALLSWVAQRKSDWRYGVLFLALAELSAFALANRPFFDYQDLLRKTAPVREIYQKDPGNYRILADSKNYALGFGGWDVWGYDTNIPLRYARFIAMTQGIPTDDFLQNTDLRQISPALGLVRLRYVFQQKDGVLTMERVHFKEAPSYFLNDRWQIVSEQEALGHDVAPGFDPLKESFLEQDPGIPQGKGGRLQAKVEIQDLSTDALKVDATLSRPALLVLDANYSSGWKALADPGSAQSSYQVMPADGFLRAVPLQAGEHHFTLRYDPEAFEAGKRISLIFLGVYLLLTLAWFLSPGARKPRV
jgi:hypothetical protein